MEPAAQGTVQQSSEVNSKVEGAFISLQRLCATCPIKTICVEGTEPLGVLPVLPAPFELRPAPRGTDSHNRGLAPAAWRLPTRRATRGLRSCLQEVHEVGLRLCGVSTLTLPKMALPAAWLTTFEVQLVRHKERAAVQMIRAAPGQTEKGSLRA
jgi:hypothetical protein